MVAEVGERTRLVGHSPPPRRVRRWVILSAVSSAACPHARECAWPIAPNSACTPCQMIITKSWDPIAMKISKRGRDDYPFSINACVLVAEMLKFIASAVALAMELKPASKAERRRLLAFSWRSNVHMCVPALLYALGNYLSFVLAGAHHGARIALPTRIFGPLSSSSSAQAWWILAPTRR